MTRRRHPGKWALPVAALFLIALVLLSMASCGGTPETSQPVEEGSKLPPGITEESLQETTGSGSLSLQAEGEETNQSQETEKPSSTATASSSERSADLAGARFTVVSATRPDSNADVISSSQREVPGDYLEVELRVENVGDDLVDLSQYSFRLWSPGIAADQYEEYYGNSGTYGKYVSENMISAVLLDYATLQPVAYKLKIGETVEDIFLFFDLNPKSTSRNEAVIKDGTNLVINKQRGEDAGEEAEINLAGYAD